MEKMENYLHLYSKYLGCDLVKPVFAENESSKPILKHITSLTNDDAEELGYDTAESFLADNKIYKDNIGLLRPEGFKYLIENGFDCFMLIESGLAIDKTLLKQVTN